MSQLNIVTIFKLKSAYHAEFQAEFKKIVEASRKEAGCIRYDLNQDVNDANTYIMLESWQSQQAIDMHNNEAHLKHFIQFCSGKVDSLDVTILKQAI